MRVHHTWVADLSPLAETKPVRLVFTPLRITKGLEIIRNMASTREIGMTLEQRVRPEELCELYDKGTRLLRSSIVARMNGRTTKLEGETR